MATFTPQFDQLLEAKQMSVFFKTFKMQDLQYKKLFYNNNSICLSIFRLKV